MPAEWIPMSSSAKGRLGAGGAGGVRARPGYEAVHVGALAAAAETTTGPLYHHFGSKLGLYSFVRADVEQRVVDRMEGALAAGLHFESDDVVAALLVAFDYAERAGFARMLSEPHPSPGPRIRSRRCCGEAPARGDARGGLARGAGGGRRRRGPGVGRATALRSLLSRRGAR